MCAKGARMELHFFGVEPPSTAPYAAVSTPPNKNGLEVTPGRFFNVVGDTWIEHVTPAV